MYIMGLDTDLVMMRCCHEDNRSILWYMVRPSWSNLSEENIDNRLPEEQGKVVDEVTEP